MYRFCFTQKQREAVSYTHLASDDLTFGIDCRSIHPAVRGRIKCRRPLLKWQPHFLREAYKENAGKDPVRRTKAILRCFPWKKQKRGWNGGRIGSKAVSYTHLHMSQLAVSYGDYVQQGQIIGYVGQTGNAYGNHCHFEIIINGRFMDPSKYIGTYYPGR